MSSVHWTEQNIVLNIFHRCVAVKASQRSNTISNEKVVIKGTIVKAKARVKQKNRGQDVQSSR